MYGMKAGNLEFVDGVDSFVRTAKAYKNLRDDGYVYLSGATIRDTLIRVLRSL